MSDKFTNFIPTCPRCKRPMQVNIPKKVNTYEPLWVCWCIPKTKRKETKELINED